MIWAAYALGGAILAFVIVLTLALREISPLALYSRTIARAVHLLHLRLRGREEYDGGHRPSPMWGSLVASPDGRKFLTEATRPEADESSNK